MRPSPGKFTCNGDIVTGQMLPFLLGWPCIQDCLSANTNMSFSQLPNPAPVLPLIAALVEWNALLPLFIKLRVHVMGMCAVTCAWCRCGSSVMSALEEGSAFEAERLLTVLSELDLRKLTL